MTAREAAARAYRFERRSACPACSAVDLQLRYRCGFDEPPVSDFLAEFYGIDASVLANGEYRLEQCRACGTFFQAEVGDLALLSDLYTHWVLQTEDPEAEHPIYAEDVGRPELSRDGHEIMAAASFLGLPLRELITLDYGMGWALWARISALLGCQSHGSDLSEPRMEFARDHGISTVSDDEIAPDTYHFINTEQVLEHMPDPAEIVGRLAAALRPGGILKVSVPSDRGVEALIGRLAAGQDRMSCPEITPIHPLEHVNCYTPEGVEALGARFGLEPVRPGLRHLYAFLLKRGSIDPRRPKKAAKELVRPIYQFRNPANLYVWLQRPKAPGAAPPRSGTTG